MELNSEFAPVTLDPPNNNTSVPPTTAPTKTDVNGFPFSGRLKKVFHCDTSDGSTTGEPASMSSNTKPSLNATSAVVVEVVVLVVVVVVLVVVEVVVEVVVVLVVVGLVNTYRTVAITSPLQVT